MKTVANAVNKAILRLTTLESSLLENQMPDEAEIDITTQEINLPHDPPHYPMTPMTQNQYQPQEDIVYIGSTENYPVILPVPITTE